jgi:hypothetical protein
MWIPKLWKRCLWTGCFVSEAWQLANSHEEFFTRNFSPTKRSCYQRSEIPSNQEANQLKAHRSLKGKQQIVHSFQRCNKSPKKKLKTFAYFWLEEHKPTTFANQESLHSLEVATVIITLHCVSYNKLTLRASWFGNCELLYASTTTNGCLRCKYLQPDQYRPLFCDSHPVLIFIFTTQDKTQITIDIVSTRNSSDRATERTLDRTSGIHFLSVCANRTSLSVLHHFLKTTCSCSTFL